MRVFETPADDGWVRTADSHLDFEMDYWPYLVVALVAVGIAASVTASLRHVLVIYEEQFALHWKDGKALGRLPAGRVVLWGSRHRVFTIDRRIRHDSITGQEVLSSDGATIRVSLLVAYKVTNPEVHYQSLANPDERPSAGTFVFASYFPSRSLAYEAAHAALRDAIGKRTMEECLAQRADIAKEIAANVLTDFESAGLALDRIVVKDIGVGGDLKRAMGDLQVAQFQARANLERARAEGAVLRSLANTARTLESNPALVQMKLLQAIESGRAQVVVGADALRIVERKAGLDSDSSDA